MAAYEMDEREAVEEITGFLEIEGERQLGRRTDDLLQDACEIIDEAQRAAHRAVNVALVQRNWLLGRRIAEEELGGEERAEYGKQAI